MPRALRFAEGKARPSAHLNLLDGKILVHREAILFGLAEKFVGMTLGEKENEVDVLRVARLAPEPGRQASIEKVFELSGFGGVERREENGARARHSSAGGGGAWWRWGGRPWAPAGGGGWEGVPRGP